MLEKKVEEVLVLKSIKDLVRGKSILQNEILGDLQIEFTSAPENGKELPLEELASGLGVGHSGTLCKYTSGLVSRMAGGKMPGGFNITLIKGHLSKAWGFSLPFGRRPAPWHNGACQMSWIQGGGLDLVGLGHRHDRVFQYFTTCGRGYRWRGRWISGRNYQQRGVP
jgi:hypothetical protein